MHLLKLMLRGSFCLPQAQAPFKVVKWVFSQRPLNQNVNYPEFMKLPLLRIDPKSQWKAMENLSLLPTHHSQLSFVHKSLKQ